MKKITISLLACLFTITCFAQIKVFTGGTVSVGSTTAPTSGYEMQLTGKSLFSDDVGIGTTAPTGRLHVYASGTDVNLNIETGGTSKAAFLQFYSTSTSWGGIRHSGAGKFQWFIGNRGDTAGDLNFYTDTTLTNRMTIKGSNGNVGIGTKNPAAKLDVVGNINIVDTNAFKIGGNKVLWNNGSATNLFAGVGAGASISSGIDNVLIGNNAGYSNTSSSHNCAIGFYALYTNTSGSGYNSAFGTGAMQLNTSGYSNTAIGGYSLYGNTTGKENTAIGYNAGYTYAADTNCTYVGYYADATANGFKNATAIGNLAKVNASNRVVIGNSSVTQIGGYQAWTNMSDGRYKINVKENVTGLEFIMKLRPVTYNLDARKIDDFLMQNMPDSLKAKSQDGMDYTPATTMIHSGFIAQEVEQVAKNVNFTSSIVHAPENPSDAYALSYAEFVVPLVKAVQEQQAMIDSLKIITGKQDSINTALQSQITDCCTKAGSRIKNNDNDMADNTRAALFQNTPNPFNRQTDIHYFIPTTSQNANVMIFDLQGKLVKMIAVTGFGSGSVTINGNELTPGMFIYSLIIDGKEMDSKRMILTEN